MLKIYGEAPPTVSVSTVIVPPVTFEAVAGNSSATDSRVYVKTFGLVELTDATFDETL